MNIMDALKKSVSAVKEWVDENKVQKVIGKGLSTNDYTDADKNKVNQIDSIPNDLVVLDGKLYLAQNGVVMDESAVVLPSGGGGGGTTSGSITLTNNLASNAITAAVGGDAWLRFSYMSTEDETGDGMAYIYVKDVLKMTKKIIPGDNEINIASCLSEGVNIVKLTCMDQYGNSRNLSYTVELVSLKLSSAFDASVPYDSDINYTYTPVVNATKTVHFIVDGTEIGTDEITTSGRQETYIIPRQSHGSHTLEVYFTIDIDGTKVPSNHLYYDLICTMSGVTTPIIACAYNNKQVTQFDTIVIPYYVYSPTSLTSDIVLSVNGDVIDELNVDRTEQKWSFRADQSGELNLTITCGTIVKTLNFNVQESDINVEATTSNLELYLSSYGRSNNELNPAKWNYGDISTVFSGFNFTSDGWQLDEDGVTVLRVSGDARLEIPTKIFAEDFRSTGKTIEIEFVSRDVLDYEAVIISCMSEGRGLQITAQRADLFSEQSAIGTQYKENEHVRISFVIEKKNENCFLLIYLNGILSGSEVYPTDDDFTQAIPVNISIGSNYCTTDIYCIRVYNNSLTRYQILDNWIADTQNGSLMIDRYSRNQVYNTYGEITIDNLPVDLPYMVIKSSDLPQFKGDKKTCSGYYVDVVNTNRSFTFTGAQIDVQGTSSQYYYVKNYKLKFKKGFTNKDGTTFENYQLNDNAVATNTFTFKADVASSEGANNVVLAQLYNDLCPVLTPPQQVDAKVRQTIDGHPIVIFWDNGSEIKFLGKYNFNNDKGTAEVFGFVDGDESWEIKQNGTDRVGWRSNDFSEGSGWENDFEARYPEDNTNTTNLKDLATWLMSTDVEAATNETLNPTVTYNGVEYFTDSVEYRLAKFRDELPDHADVDDLIFYYLFTEIFLCIDQREKNAFPTLFGDMEKWIMFFYDADSSLGIDNKGKLAFDPFLEDIDYTVGGDPIYNGQKSVLWVNLRKMYYDEITAMYQQLRVDNAISYEIVNNLFEQHQGKWCEAIFNEDMYRKCLEPMIVDKDGQYLPMLLGKKELHRKWWLYNRFRFLDSKYVTGNSMETRIMIRSKSKANVSLTSYVNMYGHVYYNSEMVEHRMERGKSYEFVWAASGAEDAVIGINDADMLTSLGDLAPLQVETIDISLATHLTSLKIGDGAQDYSNKNLTSAVFGNNILLQSVDLRNCSALNTSLDVSGCTNIEEIYCEGTSITGINLPNGGVLKVLHLPDTVTNLTICNQASLTDFILNDSSNLTTLRLENVGSLIDTPSVIMAMADGSRIRALEIDWEVDTEAALVALLNKLVKMRGLDENSNNINAAVLTGRIKVKEKVSDDVVGDFYNYFSDVVIDDGSSEIYIVNYKDWDGNVLHTLRLAEGEDAIDPIAQGIINAPFREPDQYYSYEFTGWGILPTNVNRHYIVTAQYNTNVAINFAVNGEIIYSDYVIYGANAEDPTTNGKMEIPTKDGTDDLHYAFNGWDGSLLNITMPRTLNAVWANIYPVRYYTTADHSVEPHYEQWVKEGDNAYDPVSAGECNVPSDIVYPKDKTLKFSSWTYIPQSVSSICEVDAQYLTYWAVIFRNEYREAIWEDYYIDYIQEGQEVPYPTCETPTKAQTAEYNFEFDSWDGDFSAIDAPRTYTSQYRKILRKYTVKFINDNQEIKIIENVPYGTIVSTSQRPPNPTKEGDYVFKMWVPDISMPITGDTEYEALFKFTGYLFGRLSDDSEYGTVDNPNWNKINSYWTTIGNDVDAFSSGNSNRDDFYAKYQIGGRMIIPITYLSSEGQQISTIVDVEIIGHEHDDLADGSEKKAPLTFFCKDLPNILHNMNSENGWQGSAMREFISKNILPALPDELRSIIKPVYKFSDGGSQNKLLVVTEDYCWLASCDEVGFTFNDSSHLSGQGQTYSSIFSGNDSRIKCIIDTIEPGRWWLRSSAYGSSGYMFRRIQLGGMSFVDNQSNQYYVAFGFCI